MRDLLVVGGRQPAGDLRGDFDRLADRQRSAWRSAHAGSRPRATPSPRRDARCCARRRRSSGCWDARAPQSACDSRSNRASASGLPATAGGTTLIATSRFKPRIARAIDLAHATRSERRQDRVRPSDCPAASDMRADYSRAVRDLMRYRESPGPGGFSGPTATMAIFHSNHGCPNVTTASRRRDMETRCADSSSYCQNSRVRAKPSSRSQEHVVVSILSRALGTWPSTRAAALEAVRNLPTSFGQLRPGETTHRIGCAEMSYGRPAWRDV